MYSFGPLPRQKRSGHVIGTHQKIDRVARRHLKPLLDGELIFPRITEILHFEGLRGPDGVKLKSPGRDEPRHFINPSEPFEGTLLRDIEHHSTNLTIALRAHDMTRAGFEAAWLAHAVTDGLTPAHHDPYEEQLERLRGIDAAKHTRVRSKLIMPGGGSSKQFVRNNWQYWGAKGVMTTHTLFEAGVATATKPFKYEAANPSDEQFEAVRSHGFQKIYLEMVDTIAALDMYTKFKHRGWTQSLARMTNDTLMPTIVAAVTLAWYQAYYDAKREQS